jgi:hypothetical protein
MSSQTQSPTKIWIYHCGDYVKPNFPLANVDSISCQHNSADLGYFGRFSLGLLIKTPYLFIVDDDVIPSGNWLEKCLELCNKYDAIISSAGRIIPVDDYRPENFKYPGYLLKHFYGDGENPQLSSNQCNADTSVDFGCNSWFLKTAWLRYFWSVKPFSFNIGEDIHLSASCKTKGGIQTMCPKQDVTDVCGNLKRHYGNDYLASWRKDGFIPEREKVLRYWIDDCGWKPKQW